ncbi:hypothetical protein ACXIUS_28070 [Bosea thiooxidans]|nr:hypothetical protein [Bosea sp. (in: a-proteobacteria)]
MNLVMLEETAVPHWLNRLRRLKSALRTHRDFDARRKEGGRAYLMRAER